MENNVLLGAIDAVAVPSGPVSLPYNPTGEAVDITPSPSPAVGSGSGPGTIRTGGGMVTLPTDTDTVTYFEGGPSTGGGAAPDLREDTGVEYPKAGGTSVSLGPQGEGPSPMNKKNLLLYGIGGLVLAYLLFRKK